MTQADSKSVQLQYFAQLREQRGVGQETLTTTAQTPEELYLELQQRHGFTLPREMVKVSINQAFQPMNTPLKEADQVVFIPPVAGG